jgi:hypothetical protein
MATEKISRKIKMDFKSLLSKLDSMEAPASTPAAPTIAKAVQLNEDAQLRVLAGQTTYVAEAKKKKDEEKKEEKKVDEAAEKTATTWTDSKGNKHPATKVKGDKYTGKEAEKEEKPKSKKDESVEPEFKSKFMKMVEAKKEEADKKKADKKKMEEGAKPDFLDMDKDGDKKEPMKKAVADKKDGPKKGVNPFAKKDKNESVVRSKRVVAESTDNVLSFRDMIKLVQESGGQQAIDPIDTTLFAWAQRVAASKYTESAKAEVFAGMLYERNGGRFEMYDVLSENQK